MARLEVEGLTVRLGAVDVVSDFSLALEAGRITGLIGPNGAGKTTVVDAICGTVPARGEIRLGGDRIDGLPSHVRARRGLARTFQALQLFEDLTVAENLLVAAEGAGKARSQPDTAAVLDGFGITEVAHSLPASLPHTQRVLVALARALVSEPSVLLLDEPAAGLDAPARSALAGELRRLAAEGAAVLLVDHDLALVMGLCDEVVVLDRGVMVAAGPPSELAADSRLATAYLGKSATPDPDAFPANPPSEREAASGSPITPAIGRPPLLEVVGLKAGYGAVSVVQGVDVTVEGGEVVAVLGLNGAGKTTTLSAISGAVSRMGGEIRLQGTPLPPAPHLAARRGIASVPQAPSLFGPLTVAENLRLVRGRRRQEDAPLPAVEALAGRRADQLSGGEARMVALARALAARPKLLLVDELSLGLAPAAAADLLLALRSTADAGVGVVVVEQHPHLALGLADRVYVLERGRVVAEGAASEVDVSRLLPTAGPMAPGGP